LTSSFSNIIQGAAKTSDQLAAVRKTTGLTTEEVKALSQELSKMDTRTSVTGLRDLAIEAGKLGVTGKENILGFVKAADQIKVALGEDLGEEAITKIGKLVSVFRVDEKFGLEESMLKIGSVVNELGASSAATEGYIVEFTSRLAGIAPSAKISVQDVAALGATLDSLGVQAELGSTAVGGVLAKLVTDFEGFAKISGTSAEELKKAFEEKGALESLKLVLAGVKNTSGGFDEFINKMGDVGVEGSRAKAVFGVLANNLDKLDESQKVANKSFEEGKSITQEFQLQNETFGATLDKLGKELAGIAAALSGMAQAAVNGVTGFINVLKALPQFIADNRTAFIALAGALLMYSAATIKAGASSLLFRIQYGLLIAQTATYNALLAASKGAIIAYYTIADILTGKVKLTTEVMRIWNTVIKANPLGAIIGLLTVAAAAFSYFTSQVKVATDAEKNHVDIMGEVQKATADTKAEIESSMAVLRSSTATTDEKAAALEKLKNISNEYLGGLTLENIATQEGIAIIKRYIVSLDALAEAKARVNLKAKLREQILEKDNEISGLAVEKKGAGTSITGDGDLFGINIFGRTEDVVQKDIDEKSTEKKNLENRLKSLSSETDQQVETYRRIIATKQNALKGMDKESQDAVKLAQDIAADQKILFTLTGIDDAATSGTSSSGSGSGSPTADGSVGALRKKLQGQLDATKAAYDKLDALDENAKSKNLARQRNLQQQLDNIDGKKSSSQKKSDNRFEQEKKEADKFYQDLLKLKQKAGLKELPENEAEIEAVRLKYAELVKRAKDFFVKKLIDEKKFGEENKLIVEAREAEIDAIIDKHVKKRFAEDAAKEYEESLLNTQAYYDEQKIIAANAFADNALTQQEYEEKLKALDRDELADRVTIATDYSKHVKKAAEDVTNFRKQQEQQTTKDLVDETIKRKETADSERLSKAQRGVLTAKGKGIDAEVEAKKNLLAL
ncbi:MAG TPA: phage tail tape measure protein, partial [Chitinophagaceae bacterium]|nr:phage tail tape measure protein [Chitinophagaceae bacterium]